MTAITIMIFFWAAVSSANAQGMLPAASTTTVRADTGPLLIGQTVPENLVVLESSTGTPRALLSYKAAIEVLVVQFLSPNCKDNQDQWTDLKRFYEDYKGWHVAFVAVDPVPTESPETLKQAMQKAGVPYPVVMDPSRTANASLNINAVPELVIIDESGVLRYRGPLQGFKQTPTGIKRGAPFARKAMDAIIGHTEAVPNPEPGDLGGCPIQ